MNPSAKFRAGLAWWWKQLFIGSAFLAVVVGLVTGSFWLFTEVMADGPYTKGEIPFKDVLLVILSIAAVFISALGTLAFQVLSRSIEGKIFRRSERNRRLAETLGWINTGYQYYELYRISESISRGKGRDYLDRAISETREAYRVVVEELDEKEWQVERLLLNIRNNWAYFISERENVYEVKSKADAQILTVCLEYIESRSAKFPEFTEEVMDTIDTVRTVRNRRQH